MKKTVAVIYGGRSAEHEVSLVSGKAVSENLDKEKFEAKEILIDQEGKWFVQDNKVSAEEALKGVAIAFPVLHGTYGEDGKIQGLFDMLGVAFVGSGVTESAVGMDKEFSKIIWKTNGLPVSKFTAISETQWQSDWADVKLTQLDQAKNLKLPVFVKPANLGSSIGITKVKEERDLEAAINLAFQYGSKVLVEEAVEQAREIEVSVLGNKEAEVSIPGEIVPANEFYDYNAKYENDNSKLFIPASLDARLTRQIQHSARNAYELLGLYGMARMDFLLSKRTGKFYINEANTIPGFTSISMYPKLWEASGLSFTDLLTKLIELGFEKFQEKLNYKVTWQDSVDQN